MRLDVTAIALVGSVGVLGGCGPASLPSAEAVPVAAAASEAAVDLDFGETTMNQRGNLVKDVGQWAGIGNSSGDLGVAFRVTEIETGFECTNADAEPPENGQYVALTFEIRTGPKLAGDPIGDFGIDPHDFVVLDDQGSREDDSVGNSDGCLEESERVPDGVGPGENVTGKLVVDTRVSSGEVVYNAWAWEF